MSQIAGLSKILFALIVATTISGCTFTSVAGKWTGVAALKAVPVCTLGRTKTPYAQGTGTVDNPLVICSADQLYSLASTESDWSKYVVLADNIDLSYYDGTTTARTFKTIGRYDNVALTGVPFTGNFNGAGYSISGLKLDPGTSTTAATGFFGYTNGAHISNVSLVGVTITGQSNVGGLVGYNTNSAIELSSVSGNVLASTATSPLAIGAGGLVGTNVNSLITSCETSGQVTGGSQVGGLIGRNDGTGVGMNSSIDKSSSSAAVTGFDGVAGLVGLTASDAGKATISNSKSSGAIQASAVGGNTFGGFVGISVNDGGQGAISNSTSSSTVNCRGNWSAGFIGTLMVNNGGNSDLTNVRSSGDFTTAADSFGWGGAGGGIAGIIVVTNTSFTMSKAMSTGNVTMNQNNRGGLGGLAGVIVSQSLSTVSVRDSFASGAVLMNGTGTDSAGGIAGASQVDGTSTMVFTNVYSSSVVTAAINVGALVGNNAASFTSSYYSSSAAGAMRATGGGGIAGATGLSDVAMQDSNSYVGWDFANIWKISGAKPTLR